MNLELKKPNPYCGELKLNSHVLVSRKDIYNGKDNPETFGSVENIPKN